MVSGRLDQFKLGIHGLLNLTQTLVLRAKKSDTYVKTGLNWFVVDCDLDHSVFAFRIADIGGQNSDEIEACASLGTNQTLSGGPNMVAISVIVGSPHWGP